MDKLVGAFVVAFIACLIYDEIQQQNRSPENCILPAIQATLEAGLNKLLL